MKTQTSPTKTPPQMSIDFTTQHQLMDLMGKNYSDKHL
jgi:hypothetical protein